MFLNFLCFYSQGISVKGRLADKQNKSIENATISLLNKDKEEVAYTFSDENGNFNLSYDLVLDKPFFIEISSLDYHTKEIQLNSGTNSLNNIILIEKEENIKEILLIGKKVRVVQDTTSIKVSGFTTKIEQTVEDVLKKLPGIVVSNDGTIEAHGRRIDKLLVEGEDILDKNYKLISKNLDSKVLDEVQIIDNFEDNPILKKLNNSDKVALNLKLKKGLKNIWFGNFVLGSGILSENRWKESVNLGLIKKKIKFFYLGDYNNMGEKASDLITSSALQYNNFGIDRIEYKTKISYSINSNEPQYFSKSQSIFNDALLNTVSFTTKIRKDITLRGVAYLTYDKQRQNSFSQTVLNIENNNPISYEEKSFFNNKKILASTELELKYYPNEKNYITNLFIFQNNPNEINNDLIFNSSQLKQFSTSKNFTYYNHFNHTYQITSNKVLNSYFYFGSDKRNEDTMINSPSLNHYFNLDKNDFLNTISQNSILFFGAKSKLLFKLNKIDITNSLQLEYNKEQLNNDLFSDKGLQTEYDNKISFKQLKLISDNILRYNLSKSIDFVGNISFKNLDFNYYNNSKKAFIINPSININIKETNFGKLSLSYSENSSIPEINQLFSNFQLSDYRNFIKGTEYQYPIKNSFASISYYKYNDEKRFSINTSISYIKSKSILNTTNIFSEDFGFNSYKQTSGGENYNFNFSLTHYSRKIKIASKIETKNYWSSIPLNANSDSFLISKNYTSNLKYSATSYFKFPVNFDLGISYNYNQSLFNNIKNSNITKDMFVNFNYQISKTLLAEFNNSFYFIFSKKYSFNNLVINYTPLDSKFSFRIILNNISNEKEYVYTLLNNYTFYKSTIALVPRYLLATVKYRF